MRGRVRHRGYVDLADRAESPALQDVDMEAAFAGFLDLAFDRSRFLVRLAQELRSADSGDGPREADFVLSYRGHIKLDLVALGAGEVLVRVQQLAAVDHRIDFHSGVDEYRILADRNDPALYPVADAGVGARSRAEGFEERGKIFFRCRCLWMIRHERSSSPTEKQKAPHSRNSDQLQARSKPGGLGPGLGPAERTEAYRIDKSNGLGYLTPHDSRDTRPGGRRVFDGKR